MAEQRGHDRARALVAGDAGVLIDGERLGRVPLAELGSEPSLLLGIDEEGPLFAVDEGPPREPGRRAAMIGAGGRRGEPAPEAPDRVNLREAVQLLSQSEGGLVAYLTALLNWHRGHGHCANCGAPTEVAEAGSLRECGVCGTHHHPRVDPVVIMLVTDGDRLLLGRQRVWPPRRYSALAGFVSPGESLEEAVAREVLEEAGVRVGRPEYRSSQPWPFPASLMLGFTVPYAGGELGGSDPELEDKRWFDRDQVAQAATEDSWSDPADGDAPLLLPPRAAIARRLIEGWLRA
ncbi:MAG TPA: NAD(+) diphosphatase [Thermoleophilaceae bacterium]|nr:NAD(+) diphosphatase [Thermoleophilaceae bacterium]